MSLNQGFHKLTIAEIRRETPDSVSILFDLPPDIRDFFRFMPGQHLTLRAEIDGQDVRRNYSLCVAPHEGVVRIAVKQMPGGVFSGYANTALTVGQTVEILPPMGRFVPPPTQEDAPHYAGVAGGSGITPVLSILKHTLAANPKARFTLLYGNRNSPSIMFLEELAALKDFYMGRLEVYHFLEEETEEIELLNGRLDRAKCDEILAHLINPANIDAFFICGPGPMMDTVETALREHAVPPERILVERFTTSAPTARERTRDEALQSKAAGAEMSVILDGRRLKLAFNPEKTSILESVQASGVAAPYACRSGVCTTCRAKVLEGEVAMRNNYGLTDDEVAQGYVLTCQSVPVSDKLVLSYDS